MQVLSSVLIKAGLIVEGSSDFQGVSTAITQPQTDSSTKLATTAFVTTKISNIGISNLNDVSGSPTYGDVLWWDGVWSPTPGFVRSDNPMDNRVAYISNSSSGEIIISPTTMQYDGYGVFLVIGSDDETAFTSIASGNGIGLRGEGSNSGVYGKTDIGYGVYAISTSIGTNNTNGIALYAKSHVGPIQRWDNLTGEVARFTNAGGLLIGVITSAYKLHVAGSDVSLNDLIIGKGGGQITGNITVGTNSIGALSSNTGDYLIAIGDKTLRRNTTGRANMAFGNESLTFNTTGSYNVTHGIQALFRNTTGNNNTAFGLYANLWNTTGSNNLNIGYHAGNSVNGTYGNNGSYNIFIGSENYGGITSGNYNVIIGNLITGLSSSTTNNIIIADGQGNIRFRDNGTSTILTRLIGSGTRMVVVNSAGELSTSSISGGALTVLNGLTDTSQSFAVGSTGTDFTISSESATHTFNLPSASATNRGLLTAASFTAFTNKLGYTGATTDLNLGVYNLISNNVFTGFTNVAASATLITLTVSSTPYYNITGSGGQIIKLPDATTLQNGATFTFNNNQSSGAITVNNNSNTLISSIPSGGYVTITLLSNSISAGSWDRHFEAPANVSWSTNTFDYAGSITNATWNGVSIADNRISSAATWNAKIGGSGTVNYVAKFTASGTVGNSLIFDNGSNVGIGTTSPTYKLDVNGTASVLTDFVINGTASGARNILSFGSSYGERLKMGYYASGTTVPNNVGYGQIIIDDNGNIKYYTRSNNTSGHKFYTTATTTSGSSLAMTISENQKVLIGYSTEQAYKGLLQVNGNISGTELAADSLVIAPNITAGYNGVGYGRLTINANGMGDTFIKIVDGTLYSGTYIPSTSVMPINVNGTIFYLQLYTGA